MRQRLAIWFVLPCLGLAWPSLPLALRKSAQAPPPRRAPSAAEQPRSAAAGRSNRQPLPATSRRRRRRRAAAEAAAPPAPAAKARQMERRAFDPAHSRSRSSPGPSCSLIWLLFLIWVKSADWVNRDTQIFDLGYGKWNPIMFFPFLAILLLFAFPILVGFANFWVALGLLVRVLPGTLHSVRGDAEQGGPAAQKVFTPDWFRYEFAQLAGKVGIKMEAERKADYEKGATVDLMAIGAADERDNQANLITARQSPGYLLVKELIADMVDRRSDRVILDYTQQAVVSPATYRRRVAQQRSPRPRIGRRDAGRHEDARQSQRHRAPQEAGRQVRRQVQGPLVHVPDRQPGRADRRARRACSCWAATSRLSRSTTTWACGRSWPSSGPL